MGTLQGVNGIDALLQAVAKYKKKDPASPDEEECCENLFNCLCSALVRQQAPVHLRRVPTLT